jgi:hypothetical protein
MAVISVIYHSITTSIVQKQVLLTHVTGCEYVRFLITRHMFCPDTAYMDLLSDNNIFSLD